MEYSDQGFKLYHLIKLSGNVKIKNMHHVLEKLVSLVPASALNANNKRNRPHLTEEFAPITMNIITSPSQHILILL